MGINPGFLMCRQSKSSNGGKKWREIASLLVNRKIPLECRPNIYGAYNIWSIYGLELIWPLTKKLEEIIYRCDYRMLRYMAGASGKKGYQIEES